MYPHTRTGSAEFERRECERCALARVSPIALGILLSLNTAGPTSAQVPGSMQTPVTSNSSAFSSSPVNTLAGAPDSRSEATSFATRHARYVKADWSSLPGWSSESAHEALIAFRIGCTNLARREAWAASCQAAQTERVREAGAGRNFFEQHFDVLQVRQPNDSEVGIITGYFEPLLRGSRTRQGAFVHPVYPTPDDLLYLDGRELAAQPAGTPLFARVRDRTVVMIRGSETPVVPSARQGIYRIDLGQLNSDIRDKRVRVRIVDDRVVLYPTRQDIERLGLPNSRPLAWVDNADALYSMQIQGSGKILLNDGSIIRLAYAEQNGHPFQPKVTHSMAAGVRTRGLSLNDQPSTTADDVTITTSVTEPHESQRAASAKGEPPSARVEKLIDYFLNQNPRETRPARPDTDRLPNRRSQIDLSPPAGSSKPQPDDFSPPSRPGLSVSSSEDPSYVFFRQIDDSNDGPIGALGVPLTAGRSVAVDPRTTPLGAPVFIASAEATGGSAGFRRLMVAQDTGGAIRGPVRADYFWGFGRQAGNRALQMKETFRMWVLVPKGMDVVARQREKVRTRSIDGSAADECLIADPELCVE